MSPFGLTCTCLWVSEADPWNLSGSSQCECSKKTGLVEYWRSMRRICSQTQSAFCVLVKVASDRRSNHRTTLIRQTLLTCVLYWVCKRIRTLISKEYNFKSNIYFVNLIRYFNLVSFSAVKWDEGCKEKLRPDCDIKRTSVTWEKCYLNNVFKCAVVFCVSETLYWWMSIYRVRTLVNPSLCYIPMDTLLELLLKT